MIFIIKISYSFLYNFSKNDSLLQVTQNLMPWSGGIPFLREHGTLCNSERYVSMPNQGGIPFLLFIEGDTRHDKKCFNARSGRYPISTEKSKLMKRFTVWFQCPIRAVSHFYDTCKSIRYLFRTVSMPDQGGIPFLLRCNSWSCIFQSTVSMPDQGGIPFLHSMITFLL